MKVFVRRFIALMIVCALVVCSCACAQAAKGKPGAMKPGAAQPHKNEAGGPSGNNKQPTPNEQQLPGKPENGTSLPSGDVPDSKPDDAAAPAEDDAPAKPEDDDAAAPAEGDAPAKPEDDDDKKGSGPDGKKSDPHRNSLDLNRLVEDGMISQEICDAILSHMDQSKPAASSDPETAQPESGNTEDLPELDAIAQLYADGVISEEIYNLLLEMIEADEAEPDTAE